MKTPEQIAELKERSPGGYRNLREVVVNEINEDALLPTPAVAHVRNHDEPIEDYMERRAKAESGEYRGMPGVSLGVAVRMNLLGTPRTSSANASTERQVEAGAPKARIEDQVQLLPTVTVQDGKNTGGPSQFERNTLPLNTQVLVDTDWGKFEPAIRRWEQVLGRPAPAPTKPDGKDGAHRLSSEFTEWMMGLPAGWITGVGLKRNDELKACGNGVVPQQAELALRMLLQGVEIK